MTKILVVDDDSVDREMAIRHLQGIDDVEIVTARDGREALDVVEREHPDLVLTDLRMPRLNGLELVERLADEHPLVPLVLMTSQGNEQIAVKALQAGAASYVPKRDLAAELKDTVEQMLMVAEARRQRSEILRFMNRCETSFELVNDPALITPLVAYTEDSLARIGFGTDNVRSQIGVALMEALANAMLHGNLEADSELRRNDRDLFDQQVRERRSCEPYASRRVRCVAGELPRRVEYRISDDGPGFDASRLPDANDPANLLKVGGRGLMLMRTFMDDVTFGDGGRCVTMIKSAPPA